MQVFVTTFTGGGASWWSPVFAWFCLMFVTLAFGVIAPISAMDQDGELAKMLENKAAYKSKWIALLQVVGEFLAATIGGLCEFLRRAPRF